MKFSVSIKIGDFRKCESLTLTPLLLNQRLGLLEQEVEEVVCLVAVVSGPSSVQNLNRLFLIDTEISLGDNAEGVTTTTGDGEEEVGMLAAGGSHHGAVGEHYISSYQGVNRETIFG